MYVMYSIQPDWCFKIFNVIGHRADGTPIYEKSVEVRKNIPKLPVPFRGLVYCTKPKSQKDKGLCIDESKLGFVFKCNYEAAEKFGMTLLDGKVIGEFVCDEITEMYVGRVGTDENGGYICLDTTSDVLRKQACLTEKQLYDYSNGGKLYGLHLSEVKLYPKPKDLSCFRKPCKNELYCEECGMYREHESKCGNEALIMYRAPQSWCYAKELPNV